MTQESDAKVTSIAKASVIWVLYLMGEFQNFRLTCKHALCKRSHYNDKKKLEQSF